MSAFTRSNNSKIERHYATSPVTNQLSVAILIAVATELATRNLGDAEVVPVDAIVVVPGVTAEIVG
jgi:hypothetical protein